jgi:phage-related protein
MANRKPLIPLSGEIKTPPFSRAARLEAGELLGKLQNGELIGMPNSRPMTHIAPRVAELRIRDESHNWRIIYRTDDTAILVAEIFDKKTPTTPKGVLESCKARLRRYDAGQRQTD